MEGTTSDKLKGQSIQSALLLKTEQTRNVKGIRTT